MRYIAPAGAAPDAPYVDGNRLTGQLGSIPPAAAIEHPQRELDHLITFAGLTPGEADLQQVRKAVQAMIAAATGGGSTSQFLLVSQARARLPIHPEILSGDGRMNVTSPAAGTILVPPTVSMMHRGIMPLSTSDYSEGQRTFATVANKTYHLRWSPDGGFALRDLANAGYNPDAKAEIDDSFDTRYDDMLVARVVTSASNIATITSLANKPSLSGTGSSPVLSPTVWEEDVSPATIVGAQGHTVSLNWARRPLAWLTGFTDVTAQTIGGASDNMELNIVVKPLSRYQLRAIYQRTANAFGGIVGWAAQA